MWERFNEAEARAPRMLARCTHVITIWKCFNEAEARAPRMQTSPSSSREPGSAASMRPRRARLGCNVSSAICRLGSGRFNEAEARAPRMHEIDLHARHGWLVLQ